jgi:hypothetical protein
MAEAQLVLCWGAREHIASGESIAALKDIFPSATVVGCSTGGQIFEGDVHDDLMSAVALHFERSTIKVVEKAADADDSSFAAGAGIGEELAGPELKSIFIIADGLHVNGSDLVTGISSTAGSGVIVTGGLAGDGTRFQETLVGVDGVPKSRRIAAIGFYGSALSVGYGSAGGWDEFGPKRMVSRSEKNVLFALDGEPALDLYERYLGDEAEGMPKTALRYPLLVADPANPRHAVVRAVLGIDRDARSIILGGNVPEGWSAQLMLGHFDHLADGAASAAQQAASLRRSPNSDAVALAVSCIGRRILMGQNIADEIAAAESGIGNNVQMIGFYSYGEIAPHALSGVCELHNETMTVTTITELV